MTATTRTLASGPGWHVSDVMCTAGAGDRPFEETHRDFCVAAVTSGTFRYRAQQGTAMLAPGSLLLGNPGTCYECGHEHGSGDRCLSFHFGPAYMERIVADVPGARKLAFEAPRLPPLPALAPLLAEAEAARDMADNDAFEELSLRIAGAAVAARLRRHACQARAEPPRSETGCRSGAADRTRCRRAGLAFGTCRGDGDQPLSFPAHFPPGRRDDALPIPAADPAASRGGAAAHVGR